MKRLLLLFFLFLINDLKSQNSPQLKEVILGEWQIEWRGPIITTDNPEAGLDYDYTQEIISQSDTSIVFDSQTFQINTTGQKLPYTIQSLTLYLQDKKYRCGIHDENKISVVRMVSSDFMIGYMFIRKKK